MYNIVVCTNKFEFINFMHNALLDLVHNIFVTNVQGESVVHRIIDVKESTPSMILPN